MQFLCSLFLIATLFTSLQAMIPEDVEHAAQEAAASAAEKAKAATLSAQSLISTYPQIFENTILNGLPTKIKNKIIKGLSTATSVTAVELFLEDLSNKDKSLRTYIETPEFKDRWLQFFQKIGAQEREKAAEAIKEAGKQKDLLRTQQKAAARVKPPQEIKDVVEKSPQFSTSIVSELLDTTIFKDLPSVPKEQILSYFSKATTIEEVGNVLRQISNNPLFRKYITTSEFTNRWLQFAQQIEEEDIKERTRGTWWESYDGNPRKPMSEEAINSLRTNSYGTLTRVQNRALLALGTNNALDRYIEKYPYIQVDATKAIEYIVNPAVRKTSNKLYVPLLIRLLKTKHFNVNDLIYFNERVGDQVNAHLESPLTYVLSHENNDPYLIKLLLEAGADVTETNDIFQKPLEAAVKIINKNTLKNIQLLIAAKADVTKTSEATISKLLNSADPASTQILGTLLEHHAPVTPAHVRLANELLQDAIRNYPANNPARDKFKIKADLINHYASTITKTRAKVGL